MPMEQLEREVGEKKDITDCGQLLNFHTSALLPFTHFFRL